MFLGVILERFSNESKKNSHKINSGYINHLEIQVEKERSLHLVGLSPE
jgi:hypothetical protein